MSDVEARTWRADLRLMVAIVACLVLGSVTLAWAVWDLTHGPVLGRRGWPINGMAVGLLLFMLGVYEMRHRLRRGPQQPGRRVKLD